VRAAVATFAGTASAQATQGTFYNQETLVFPETGAICTGFTGTITDVVRNSGHFVSTDNAFHFSGLTLQDSRVDFSDGTYILCSSPGHFEGGITDARHSGSHRLPYPHCRTDPKGVEAFLT
jgi:hypothetical protein